MLSLDFASPADDLPGKGAAPMTAASEEKTTVDDREISTLR